MKVCKECGEENPFSEATNCRKCGAELGAEAGPEPITNNDVTDSPSYADQTKSPSDSAMQSETSNFEEPETEQDEHASFEKDEQVSRIADPFNPNFDSVEEEVEGSCSGTVEVDLPDDSEDDEEEAAAISEDNPEIVEEQQSHANQQALAEVDRSKLIADLQTKIPTVVKNGNDDFSSSSAVSNTDSRTEFPETGEPSLQDFSSDFGSESDPETLAAAPTVASPGIENSEETNTEDVLERNRPAYFDKNRLVFPADIVFKPNDRVSFDHEVFILKKKARDNKSYMLYGVLGLIVILVLVSQFLRNTSEYYPPLAGVVVDASSGRVLPDVRVTIDELNKSVISNSSGVFIFELVPNGPYTIRADAPDYTEATLSFFQGDGSSPVVALTSEKKTYGNESPTSRTKPDKSKESKPEPEQKYGAIRVETDVADAAIYLDNKKYGSGSRKIDRVLEGKHKLVVAMDGYEKFDQMVTVRKDQTTIVSAELTKIKTVKREPTADEYVQLADSSLVAGDFQSAIAFYSKALGKEEKAETYYKRAQVYHKAGKPGDARYDLMRAGNLFASQGQATSAIASFNGVLDLFPNDMKALRARGYANINRGQYELALADFETACNLDENSYENQIGRGNAYAVLGRHKDAINAYKDAEKLTDKKAEVYALMAMTSLARGKEKDARKYYEKFVEAATPEDEQKYSKDPDWQRLKQIAANN